MEGHPPYPKTEVQTAQGGAGEPQGGDPQQAGTALPAYNVAPRLGAKACRDATALLLAASSPGGKASRDQMAG